MQQLEEYNDEWGWWSVFKSLEDLQSEVRGIMKDPTLEPLLERREYTPLDIQQLLTVFGGCLAWLYVTEGKMEAQAHALKESYKKAVATQTVNIVANSEKAKEAKALEDSEILRQTGKMAIGFESLLIYVKGVAKAYQAAYDSLSRIVTVQELEANNTTSRIP